MRQFDLILIFLFLLFQFYKDVVALKHSAAVTSGSLGTYALTSNVLVVTRYVLISKISGASAMTYVGIA